jgi:anti-sigma factor ChrR (cupin superfamily)
MSVPSLNADFTRRAAVHAAQLDWVPSPVPGIERRMLDRVGAEVARATSIVRYAPHSRFSPHVHGGGEEILVLEGVFSDEHGDFAPGAYLRNPPASSHTPGSEEGCVIFVKLWQFDPNDRHQVRVATDGLALPQAEGRPGVELAPLHADAHETVRIERWAASAQIALSEPGGIEVLVLEGGFEENGESFRPQSWLRLPPGAVLRATAGANGCRVYLKSGHLKSIPPAPSGA